MGDMAEMYSRKRHYSWQCPDCDGSGLTVVEDSTADSGERLEDCPTCGGDGVRPGHPSKDL